MIAEVRFTGTTLMPGHIHRLIENLTLVKTALADNGLVRAHAFASGNRRTALLITKEFLLTNNGTFGVPDDPMTAQVLQGVREGFYTPEALQHWLRTGDIHAFHR